MSPLKQVNIVTFTQSWSQPILYSKLSLLISIRNGSQQIITQEDSMALIMTEKLTVKHCIHSNFINSEQFLKYSFHGNRINVTALP